MIDLRFIPIFTDPEFLSAADEYQQIWATDGVRIVESLSCHTGLTFLEKRIAVVVYEGVSFSGRNPTDIMKLRASYSYEVKQGTLVHELGHRLLFNLKRHDKQDEHVVLNLFLYDVWVELYGQDCSDRLVVVEKARSKLYEHAWDQVLAMSAEERRASFLEYKGKFQ